MFGVLANPPWTAPPNGGYGTIYGGTMCGGCGICKHHIGGKKEIGGYGHTPIFYFTALIGGLIILLFFTLQLLWGVWYSIKPCGGWGVWIPRHLLVGPQASGARIGGVVYVDTNMGVYICISCPT